MLEKSCVGTCRPHSRLGETGPRKRGTEGFQHARVAASPRIGDRHRPVPLSTKMGEMGEIRDFLSKDARRPAVDNGWLQPERHRPVRSLRLPAGGISLADSDTGTSSGDPVSPALGFLLEKMS